LYSTAQTRHHNRIYLTYIPTRRSSDLAVDVVGRHRERHVLHRAARGREGVREDRVLARPADRPVELRQHDGVAEERLLGDAVVRSEEHTSELQSLRHLVCRLLLEKKKR